MAPDNEFRFLCPLNAVDGGIVEAFVPTTSRRSISMLHIARRCITGHSWIGNLFIVRTIQRIQKWKCYRNEVSQHEVDEVLQTFEGGNGVHHWKDLTGLDVHENVLDLVHVQSFCTDQMACSLGLGVVFMSLQSEFKCLIESFPASLELFNLLKMLNLLY